MFRAGQVYWNNNEESPLFGFIKIVDKDDDEISAVSLEDRKLISRSLGTRSLISLSVDKIGSYLYE